MSKGNKYPAVQEVLWSRLAIPQVILRLELQIEQRRRFKVKRAVLCLLICTTGRLSGRPFGGSFYGIENCLITINEYI